LKSLRTIKLFSERALNPITGFLPEIPMLELTYKNIRLTNILFSNYTIAFQAKLTIKIQVGKANFKAFQIIIKWPFSGLFLAYPL
jgi:hypothetical protein